MLSLRKADQATEAEKARKLDYWARLFRATTWEELRRLAGKSEVFKAMIVTMAELTADEKIRMQCEAREIYNKRERTWQVVVEEEKANTLAEKNRADKAEAQSAAEKERADKAEAEIAVLRLQIRDLRKCQI